MIQKCMISFMLYISLRQYEYVVAVAEAGSFTSATVILNLSQSAISRQIQSLEEDLKVKLFERHARE